MRRYLFRLLLVVFLMFFVMHPVFDSHAATPASNSNIGFNIRALQNDTPDNIKNVLNYLTQCKTVNVNALRVWADGDPNKIKALMSAAPAGMKFTLTLTDYYGISNTNDPTGYYQQSINPNSSEYQRIQNVVQTITSDPIAASRVGIWEVMNEPNCNGSQACSDAQHQYIRTISDLIYSYDSNHLISPGLQAQNTGGERFDNGGFDAITNLPHITANSCHLYPEDPTSIENCKTALQKTKAAGKYFYVGEAGLKGPGDKICSSNGATNACTNDELNARATKLLQLRDEFTSLGADGFDLWQFNPPASAASRPDDYSFYPGDPLCGAPNDLQYVPVPIPDATYFSKASSSKTDHFRPSGDEFTEERCYRQEVGSTEKLSGPDIYRKYDFTTTPAMRPDAGLNFSKGGVFGGYCGGNKSEPLMLHETAPFKLMQVPQCKDVKWMGEIQMNYGAQLTGMGLFPVPFAKEIADQWEGDWDASHVSESVMAAKEKLAFGTDQSGTTNTERVQALSEIERRTGVLRKILSSQVQDQMKCDLIEYVNKKGGLSIYSGFHVDGKSMLSIPCPPNVTDPNNFTPVQRADWENQWGETWKKLPLVPNEKSIGIYRFVVCDDRTYTEPYPFPEVMRLGLAGNALFQAIMPKTQQDQFFDNGYQPLRDPLKSELLLGFAGSRSIKPRDTQPILPSVPYLANKTMDQLAAEADKDPKCTQNVDNFPRPPIDNGRCMHFVPTGQYDDNTLNTDVQRMKDMGITWTLALYDDENVLKRAAAAFASAGIQPVWRWNKHVDQAPSGWDWNRDISIMKQYGNADVKQNGPLIQLYNEPGDPREYSSGTPDFSVYLNNFTSMSQRIMAAGGRVGIQLQDPAELAQLIHHIQSDPSIDQTSYWSKIFFVPHLYANGNPVNWTQDEIGQFGFLPFAEVFQQELGFVPKMIVGEGGPEVKDQPGDTNQFTRAMHADYVTKVYNQFETGTMTDGRPLPDYLMAFCNWIIDAAGNTQFANMAWYGNLSGKDLTDTINAVKAMPNTERLYSCQRSGASLPNTQNSQIQSFLRFRSIPTVKMKQTAGDLIQSVKRLLFRTVHLFSLIRLPQFVVYAAEPCMPVESSIELVNDDPNNFVYALVVKRTACAPPGVLGDIHIDPPKNYEAANPGKTGPHVQSMVGNELRFLSNYEAADGFMPQVHSIEELKQYTWETQCKRVVMPNPPEVCEQFYNFDGKVAAPSEAPPDFTVRCNSTISCCVTIDCPFACKLCARAQMSPSDSGGGYSRNHEMIGVRWDGKGAGEGGVEDPIHLIWEVPAWFPGDRPLPVGCSIDVPKPTKDRPAVDCSSKDDDKMCSDKGFEACSDTKKSCGDILCVKGHDRVVDEYQSVPFLASVWKQAAGAIEGNLPGGFFNIFKSTDTVGKNTAPPSVGCTDNTDMVLDQNGNFVPNPGAGDIGYGFDQRFGFGTSVSLHDFGKNEVTVVYVKPTNRAKVLYYHLGGLCNANMWMSEKVVAPFALQSGNKPPSGSPATDVSRGNGSAPAGSGSFGQLSGGTGNPSSPPAGSPAPQPTPLPTPLPTPALSPAPAAEVQAVAQSVAKVLPTAPVETPKVSTVTNAPALIQQTGVSDIQAGDKIVTYEQAQQVVVYRPDTQQIVAKPTPVLIAIRNGTIMNDLFDAFETDIRQFIPFVIIVEKREAVTRDYTTTMIYDVSETKGDATSTLASQFGWGVTLTLPANEQSSSGDYIVFLGSPRIALYNGTTTDSVVSSFESALSSSLPSAVVVEKSTAQQQTVTRSVLVDVSGTRPAETQLLGQKLGISVGTLPAGEAKPLADYLIILGADQKK